MNSSQSCPAKVYNLADEAMLQTWIDAIIGEIRKALGLVDEVIEKEQADAEEIFRKAKTGKGGTRSGLRQIAKEIEMKYAHLGLKVEVTTKGSHPERYRNGPPIDGYSCKL